MNYTTQAQLDVLAERQRQIQVEQFSPRTDDNYESGQLAEAAICYCFSALKYVMAHDGSPPKWWPWAKKWYKPTTPRRDLVKAAALLIAEIERLDRL